MNKPIRLQEHGHKTWVWDFAIALLAIVGFAVLITSPWYWLQATAAVALALLLWGSFIEPQWVRVHRKTVSFPIQMPLRVAVITDLHIGPYKGGKFVERVVRMVNALNADCIVLLGDFVEDERTHVHHLESLKHLQAPLGVYGIFGNHDSGHHHSVFGAPFKTPGKIDELTRLLEQSGVQLLRNTHQILSVKGQKLALAGVDDTCMDSYDPANSFAGIPESTPVLLLAHNPDAILDERTHRAHLILSGHTHGGQICLPLLGPLAPIPSILGRKYAYGTFAVGKHTTLLVSCGVGESLVRARLFRRPEILLLELRRGT